MSWKDLSSYPNTYIGPRPRNRMDNSVMIHMVFVAYYDDKFGHRGQYLEIIKNRFTGEVGWRHRNEIARILKRQKEK